MKRDHHTSYSGTLGQLWDTFYPVCSIGESACGHRHPDTIAAEPRVGGHWLDPPHRQWSQHEHPGKWGLNRIMDITVHLWLLFTIGCLHSCHAGSDPAAGALCWALLGSAGLLSLYTAIYCHYNALLHHYHYYHLTIIITTPHVFYISYPQPDQWPARQAAKNQSELIFNQWNNYANYSN